MLSLHVSDRAILHIDGDSFFASCETSLDPSLRGKPVVTGKERGIASSMSYEAKALGVKRGMTIAEILAACPGAIILPSDYETYSLFSKRMFAIVRRYTPTVEEYGIDECFADLTGLRRPLHKSYEAIAESIKRDLDSELGMTFSLGLAPTKVLAKIGSKWKKPDGLTFIKRADIEDFLRALPVEKVWGIGPQTTALLNKHGITTALALARKKQPWVVEHLSKPYHEIWRELRGELVHHISTEEKHDYQSISKTKTFTPPSNSRAFIFSQLSKNIENACIKARRHDLAAKKIFFFLKTQSFRFHGLELSLDARIAEPNEVISLVDEHFDEVFRKNTLYRATGIVLMDLEANTANQLDLFGRAAELTRWRRVYAAVDALDSKFGKHTVFLASTLPAIHAPKHNSARNDTARRTRTLFKGETARQRIGLPMLGVVK